MGTIILKYCLGYSQTDNSIPGTVHALVEQIEGTQYYRFSDSEEGVEKRYGLISPKGKVLLPEEWEGIYRLLLNEQVFFQTWLPDMGLSALYDPRKETWVFPQAQYTHFTFNHSDRQLCAHKVDGGIDSTTL